MSTDSRAEARQWQARWIGRPGACLVGWERPVLPAPLFRRLFHLNRPVRGATLRICGLGYYELHLNGERVGDHVLDPVVTQYDQRVRYVVYEVTSNLKRGDNAVGIMLGNGWYNSHTPETWHFDKATWRDYPKLLLQLDVEFDDGSCTTLCSDSAWRVSDGPVRFDGLRNGETYDARYEKPGWTRADFNDDGWESAVVVAPPGGIVEQQACPPCKVMETLTPVAVNEVVPGVAVYDFGENVAGWVQLRVRGPAGTEVTLRYAECLQENGDIDQSNIKKLVRGGDFQTDRYILKGEDEEVWEPHFTYHGFRYVQVTGDPQPPSPDRFRGRVVYTAFDPSGRFECSDPTLNTLQACTLRSFKGNFVGIPTDCPHREKNGWTGDAQVAAETGLMNFKAASAYRQWLDSMVDVQRRSGQVPGIVPSTGWGYNWGSGPAWDSALILIPWYIYLYTGDLATIARYYDAIRRYLDYCDQMADCNILDFGLGDWCHPEPERAPDAALTSTAYYFVHNRLLSRCANLLGKTDDREAYAARADAIGQAFHNAFYAGDGVYGNGGQTALACALYQGLAAPAEKASTLQRLVEVVEENGCCPDFGILGAKYVPRALAENGRADLAFHLITQPDFPGWVHWLRQGATTLWEAWGGGSSYNHIMFGDIGAWMYHYLGGIRPDPRHPGFKRFHIEPHPLPELTWVRAEHDSPYGLIRSDWEKTGGLLRLDVIVPRGTTALVRIPGWDAESVRIMAKTAPGTEEAVVPETCDGFVELAQGTYGLEVPAEQLD